MEARGHYSHWKSAHKWLSIPGQVVNVLFPLSQLGQKNNTFSYLSDLILTKGVNCENYTDLFSWKNIGLLLIHTWSLDSPPE